jgi:hypothetical protein
MVTSIAPWVAGSGEARIAKITESPDDHNESYGVDAPFLLRRLRPRVHQIGKSQNSPAIDADLC